ncbi:MAG: ABC transporter ATP-binding protein [Peptococcaceae bacterium]|nr:ABC transporter ATP-binding protein [Peptococcaceae bacterium]MDR2736882.1 ABC transporter ATP-binding protein [Gracilibacteraceae bacterium]
MIEIDNVSKSFDKTPVLNNISMHIGGSEIVCLLGPSGAGKTTLIRLITGAIKADAGRIRVADINVPSINLYKMIGLMPQNDALYADLTGLENLMFFGGLYDLKGSVLKDRVHEVLTLLDLVHEKDMLVAHYSGGMKKRLSLAMALLHKPKVLLLDEPTVGIEPQLRRTIWAQFHTLRDSGVSMIVSTHVMDEAAKCDRTAILYSGGLMAFDTTENLIAGTTKGNIEELFFMAKEAQL